MLMADAMGSDGSMFVEDDGGLAMDLNLFWEIMAEDNNSDTPEQPMDLNLFWEIMAEDNNSDPPEQQNSPEDLSKVKQQNVLSSDAGNGEAENSQQMGLMQLERTVSSWELFRGPNAFLSSYNPEAWVDSFDDNFDDDADVCIIENLSDPSRASRPINTKRVASYAAVSDSGSHMGMGGTKFRANDERLIFPAVVQEMMVCEQCGGAGFENAYVYCVNCLNFVIHRYCLPSLPAAFDEFVHWLCVDCESELGGRAGAKGAGKAPE